MSVVLARGSEELHVLPGILDVGPPRAVLEDPSRHARPTELEGPRAMTPDRNLRFL